MRCDVTKQHTRYEWQREGVWEKIEARSNGECHEPETESADSFFIYHYWGYNRQRDGATMEYEVTHLKWCVRPALLSNFDAGLKTFIGEEWGDLLESKPQSFVLAEGSEVAV